MNPGKCNGCTGYRPILEAPRPARIMFVGDAPKDHDERADAPLAGMVGREFNGIYLERIMSMSRSEVYVTNAQKCVKGDNAPACLKHWFDWEVRVVRPEIIVPMGAGACSLFGIDVNMEHGIPRENWSLVNEFGAEYWRGTVFPIYHPSYGVSVPDAMISIRQDLETLLRYMNGERRQPAKPYSCILLAGDDVAEHLRYSSGKISMDTETVPVMRNVPGRKRLQVGNNPFCLSYSVDGDLGVVVLASDRKGCSHVRDYVERSPLIMHNGLYDIPILNTMWSREEPEDPSQRLMSRPGDFDTMRWAYNATYPEKGLKGLAYRHLGIHMTEFPELVAPHYAAAWESFLEFVYRAPEVEAGHEYTLEVNKTDRIRLVCSCGQYTSGWFGAAKYESGLEKANKHIPSSRPRRHPLSYYLSKVDEPESMTESQWNACIPGYWRDYIEEAIPRDDNAFSFETWLNMVLMKRWVYRSRQVEDCAMDMLASLKKNGPDGLEERWYGFRDYESYPEPPVKSIADVPLEKMVQYSGLDAVVTYRLHDFMLAEYARLMEGFQ